MDENIPIPMALTIIMSIIMRVIPSNACTYAYNRASGNSADDWAQISDV